MALLRLPARLLQLPRLPRNLRECWCTHWTGKRLCPHRPRRRRPATNSNGALKYCGRGLLMKTLLNPFAAVIVLAALPAVAIRSVAQWPDYPATGVPRTPEGKAKLDAPAPKAPDGHPDLSGVWDLRGTGGRGGPADPARRRVAPAALQRADLLRKRLLCPLALLRMPRSRTLVPVSRKVCRCCRGRRIF